MADQIEVAFEDLPIGSRFVDSETRQTWIKASDDAATNEGGGSVAFEKGEQVMQLHSA